MGGPRIDQTMEKIISVDDDNDLHRSPFSLSLCNGVC